MSHGPAGTWPAAVAQCQGAAAAGRHGQEPRYQPTSIRPAATPRLSLCPECLRGHSCRGIRRRHVEDLEWLRGQAARSASLSSGCLSPTSPRPDQALGCGVGGSPGRDRKSTRLNSSHVEISYAVFCLKKKKKKNK